MYIKKFLNFRLNEINLVNIGEEESEFLKDVKDENPELYSKFYTLVKNRGLSKAKEEYLNYDPDHLKQERKKKIKSEKDEVKSNLKSNLPTKSDIRRYIKDNFLTDEIRKIMFDLNIPQLPILFNKFENDLVINRASYQSELSSILKYPNNFNGKIGLLGNLYEQKPGIQEQINLFTNRIKDKLDSYDIHIGYTNKNYDEMISYYTLDSSLRIYINLCKKTEEFVNKFNSTELKDVYYFDLDVSYTFRNFDPTGSSIIAGKKFNNSVYSKCIEKQIKNDNLFNFTSGDISNSLSYSDINNSIINSLKELKEDFIKNSDDIKIQMDLIEEDLLNKVYIELIDSKDVTTKSAQIKKTFPLLFDKLSKLSGDSSKLDDAADLSELGI